MREELRKLTSSLSTPGPNAGGHAQISSPVSRLVSPRGRAVILKLLSVYARSEQISKYVVDNETQTSHYLMKKL